MFRRLTIDVTPLLSDIKLVEQLFCDNALKGVTGRANRAVELGICYALLKAIGIGVAVSLEHDVWLTKVL